MYSNIYFNTDKIMLETIVKKTLQWAFIIRDKLDPADSKMLESLMDQSKMKVEEFLFLDDYKMYDYFKKWDRKEEEAKEEEAKIEDKNRIKILSCLCASLLGENNYKSALDVSSDGKESDALYDEIKEMLSLDFKEDSPENFAVFKEKKNTSIYPGTEKKDSNAAILVSNQNGEIEDFGGIVKFNQTEITCHYLFWSEKVLRYALIDHGYSEEAAKKKGEQVKKLIESYKPRNHIEIERKYSCAPDTLDFVKEAIESKNFDSFVLEKPFKKKEQRDFYFDTKDYLLCKKNCTLRIRRLENSYVCTVKLPVESESFGRNSPTARHEYEMELSIKPKDSDNIDELLKSQKKFILKRLGKKITEDDFGELQQILIINNNREKGVVKDNKSVFRCEVCLDNVFYSKPEETKKIEDWQVEVELKSEYLTHVILDKFTAKLETLMKENSKEFQSTHISKLDIGLQLLNSSPL